MNDINSASKYKLRKAQKRQEIKIPSEERVKKTWRTRSQKKKWSQKDEDEEFKCLKWIYWA